MDKVITEEKEQALELRWIQLATKPEDSSPLSGLHVEDGKVVGADGFRMHIAPVPEVLGDLESGQTVRIRGGKKLHKTPGRVYDCEEITQTYPDFDQVVPDEEPQAVIAVSPQFLREALEIPRADGMVVIRIYGPSDPLTVEDVSGDYLAVVMPQEIPEEAERDA